ncbi:hypothetical protein J6590_077346, partial [Homalodisca vitripennis]
ISVLRKENEQLQRDRSSRIELRMQSSSSRCRFTLSTLVIIALQTDPVVCPDRLSVDNFRSHERLYSSELQRLNKLISEEEIGDRKPSHFLRHIHSPVGAIVMQDNLRWIIWLQRLWSTVRAIFKTQLELKIDN